jgi:hypothetical protein
MPGRPITRADFSNGYFDGAVARILELQRPNGAIPWYDGGILDPWNHVEAAMGLTVVGEIEAAKRAYAFLKDSQLPDGAWWSQYGAAVPLDDHKYAGDGESEKRLKDTNMTAYIATGIWHFYRVTDDETFLREYWPVVDRAMQFVIAHQSAHGEIRWAAESPTTQEDDALVTGCASIYKSLECAILIARAVGETQAEWERARAALGDALRNKPDRFDRTWAPKDGFSMDWYYPVLAGIVTGEAAIAHLDAQWSRFVEPGLGCRCVDDQPWVTIAESCELALAVLRTGRRGLAEDVFAWQHQWRDDDGAYWMGYQFAENVAWPVEKPAWTAAAAILAADALTGYTNAADLFTRTHVPEAGLKPAQKP